MTLKKYLGLCSALAAVFSASGQTALAAAGKDDYSIVTTTTVVSQYMEQGQRLSGFAVQPTVEYTSGKLALGVWGNTPIQRVENVSDPELNLSGAYTVPVNSSLTVAPGFIFYVYPNAPTDAGYYRSTFEPSIAVNYTFKGVRYTPKVYYDVVLRGLTTELAAAYAWPLQDLGTELDFTASVGGYLQRDAVNDSQPRTKAWGDYWQFGVATPFQLTRASKLMLGWSYMNGSNGYTKTGMAGRVANPLEAGRGVFSVTYSASF